jgi:hypothetical protein
MDRHSFPEVQWPGFGDQRSTLTRGDAFIGRVSDERARDRSPRRLHVLASSMPPAAARATRC